MLDALATALEPTWHEARVAGRIERHTEILRAVAHEISNDPKRKDRPASAAEAKTRFAAFLADLAAATPRTGLAAPTGAFIDDLIARAERYADHLFVCFDDSRIPATTNGLEGFFGDAKAAVRRSLRAGSTTNSVVSNLGEEFLVAFRYVRRGPRQAALAGVRTPSASVKEFDERRNALRKNEQAGVRRRSLVRRFTHHLARLLGAWNSSQETGP